MRATRLLLVLPVVAALASGAAADAATAELCASRGRRCSTPPRPASTQTLRAFAAARLFPGERVVVPVVYHLVYGSFLGEGERGDEDPDDFAHAPPLALVHHQTRALNRAFRGTGFSFRTAAATARDFAPWRNEERPPGVPPSVHELAAMAADLTAGSEESLHVFLLRRVENRAAAPDSKSIFHLEGIPGADGILMNWDYLPVVERLRPMKDDTIRRYYFEGEMLVHLVGHYFGLLHTYEAPLVDGAPVCDPRCAQTTDYVRDTPAHRWVGVSGRCIPTDTCKDLSGLDPMTNYMNGEPDLCASEFTPGQVERMERLLRLYRPNFIVSAAAGGQ